MRAPASTNKKVVVQLMDERPVKGYLNPASLAEAERIDLLTLEGEHSEMRLADVKCIYFVRDFQEPFEPERKVFLSRPKLDGLWVKLRFRDEDEMEGIVANDLLEMLKTGLQLTPPDLHGNTFRMFIPRTALSELRVMGVVGVAKRGPRVVKPAKLQDDRQAELFGE